MTRNPVQDNEDFSATYLSGILNAHNQEAIVSGATPSKGSGDFDVDVDAGEAMVQGSLVSIGATTVTLSTSASEDRVDIITVNSAGTVSATEGTAGSDPVAPDIPSGEVLIATVLVEGGSASLSSAGSVIADYRTILEKSPTFETVTTREDGASVTAIEHKNRNAANGDEILEKHTFEDSGGAEVTATQVLASITDTTDASEDGRYRVQVAVGGSLTTMVEAHGGNDATLLRAPGSDPGASAMSGNQVTFFLDETNDDIKVRWQESGGTNLTATIGSFPQADYVTITTDASLDNERTLNGGTGITVTDNGAGSSVDVGITADGVGTTEIDTAALDGSGLQVTDNDSPLDVGAGTGISVSATAVAVDQSFAPTWTGTHTFDLRVLMDGVNLRNSDSIQDAGTDAIQFSGTQDVAIPNGAFLVGGTGTPIGGSSQLATTSTATSQLEVEGDSDGTGAEGDTIGVLNFFWNGTSIASINAVAGADTTNRDEGDLQFQIAQGGAKSTALELTQETQVRITTPNTSTGTTLVVASNSSSLQQIQRDSSTLRHKHNIQPLNGRVDPQDVLDIDPIHYTRDGRPEVGFGAEHFDFAPLSDGLAYDGEGRVAGFLAGSRVIDAAQQVVLQDHEDRISQLEQEIAA